MPFSLSAFSVLSTYRSSLSLLRLRLSRACEIPGESWRNDFANIKETFHSHLMYLQCRCRTMVDFNITHPRTQTCFNDRRRVFHLVLLVEADPRGQSQPTTLREKWRRGKEIEGKRSASPACVLCNFNVDIASDNFFSPPSPHLPPFVLLCSNRVNNRIYVSSCYKNLRTSSISFIKNSERQSWELVSMIRAFLKSTS